MVSILIVGHSRPLALALRDLARQVAPPSVQIGVAAGAGPDHLDFGTDAIEIMEVIQQIMSPDGVLVLMDLGSAVLSAQTALDFLSPEEVALVRLCPAPLIEGLVAAVVQAGVGSSLDEVFREAQAALGPKMEQIGEQAPAEFQMDSQPAGDVRIQASLVNAHGLHARPAAKFVQAAASYGYEIQIRNLTNGRGPVSARSLNGVITLGAVGGHDVELSASGPQAQSALQDLAALIASGFGEPASGETAKSMPVEELRNGRKQDLPAGAIPTVAVSEGYALAPLARFQTSLPEIDPLPQGNPQEEQRRLMAALDEAKSAIQAHRRQVALRAGEEQAAIFDAHQVLLSDPELLASATDMLQTGLSAPAAWQQAIQITANTYRALDDDYLRQRAVDVEDAGREVLVALAGNQPAQIVHFDQPVILVAEELSPSETAQLDLERVHAMLTVGGGPTSHSAILARSLGIPCLAGIPEHILHRTEDTLLGVDGFNGYLWLNPDAAQQKQLTDQRQAWLEERQQLQAASHSHAETLDGVRIEVAANIGSLEDAHKAIENGAEGVGLLRTEFLFLSSPTAPDEATQTELLSTILQAMQGRPVLVRTLDVGGDKPLPYIDLPVEANPFLGVRAIRLHQQRPDLLHTQARAILRAGLHGPVRIMFPMIAEAEEIIWARQQMQFAHDSLETEAIPHRWPVETGIMIEIPGAAVMADKLAPLVDFFSIGTNDLTQYTLAAERGNPQLASLADALHPAVLRLIGDVCKAASAHGKWVGVCGELAGDPLAVPVLVGLGVRELSMNSGSIPRTKAILRNLRMDDAKSLAEKAIACSTAAEVRRALTQS